MFYVWISGTADLVVGATESFRKFRIFSQRASENSPAHSRRWEDTYPAPSHRAYGWITRRRGDQNYRLSEIKRTEMRRR